MRKILLVVAALALMAALAAPAAAKRRSMLPKHTAYGAEVAAEIQGDSSLLFHDVNVTKQVCPTVDPPSSTVDRN